MIITTRKKIEAEISKRTSAACEHIISEMGAELHDDLIQKLSVFRLYIDKIERSSNDVAEIESLAIKMRTDFEQVVKVIKGISRRLLPVRMEGDTLADMLRMLCQNMQLAGSTGHIHFECQGEPPALDATMEIYVVRIVQELIHNAFKHSSAWHVWVRVVFLKNTLTIEVEDDGSGFSKIPEFIQTLRKKHNTLRIRTIAIGGTIDYLQGSKGLLARLKLIHNQQDSSHNNPLRNA
jgi:signal transduction histidine kinase